MSALTWRSLERETAERLASELEARWMIEEVSGYRGAERAEIADVAPAVRHVARIDAMVARRLAGEPVQYVLGSWAFRTLDLFVDRRVLIPRPETEQVVEVALAQARARPRPLVVADLGTGSGAIALSLAAELPVTGVEVWATDASADALDVARANLAGIGRAAANVRLALGDWFEALPDSLRGRLDLVVSNPPYVGEREVLDPSVADWEPRQALVAGPTGLECVERLAHGASEWLAAGGVLVVEIGASQGAAAAEVAHAAGLVDVRVEPDLAGRDRVLVARR